MLYETRYGKTISATMMPMATPMAPVGILRVKATIALSLARKIGSSLLWTDHSSVLSKPKVSQWVALGDIRRKPLKFGMLTSIVRFLVASVIFGKSASSVHT